MANIVAHTIIDDNDGQRWHKRSTLILCGMNAAGDVEGLAQRRRAGDAVVLDWLVKTLTAAARAR